MTNAAPTGGHTEATPRTGVAALDSFSLESLDWSDDLEDLPLVFSFSYINGQVRYNAARCRCYRGIVNCSFRSLLLSLVSTLYHRANVSSRIRVCVRPVFFDDLITRTTSNGNVACRLNLPSVGTWEMLTG